MDYLNVIYHVRGDAESIEERARAIAVEQSVEMPLAAIDDAARALARSSAGSRRSSRKAAGLFEVRIALAARPSAAGSPASSSTCCSATRRCTMTSTLHDVELPRRPGRRVRRPAARVARAAAARRRGRAGADLLGAQAAGSVRRRSSRSWRGASRTAASTTSRTTTASPTRPIRRSRRACEAIGGAARSTRGRPQRATCRASRATSTPCARRSRPRNAPASIPSWSPR